MGFEYHHYWLGGWLPHFSMCTSTTLYAMIYIYLCLSPLLVGRLISSFVHVYSYNLVWHDLHLPLPITTTGWEVDCLIFPCVLVQPCMTWFSSTSAYHHYWLGGWFPHLSMSTRTTLYDMIFIYLCLSPLLVGRLISSFVHVYAYNLVWQDFHLPLPITTTGWEVDCLIFPCVLVQPCMTWFSSTSAYHHY
jgi:hypothetical protein